MRKMGNYYEFAGVRFLPDRSVIEVCETNQIISLSPTQRNFLLALVEKPGRVVTYEEFRVKVWPHEPEMSRRIQHTIHVTKRNLIMLLKENGVKVDFIESVPSRGYRLGAELSPVSEEEKPDTEVEQGEGAGTTPPQAESNETGRSTSLWPLTFLSRLLGRHWAYITVGSILYGLLFWIALLLEAAYQFNVYGVPAIWLGLLLTAINTVAGAAALVSSYKRLRIKKGGGLFVGLGVLIAAIVGSCWLASLYLPDAPVTLTTFQAQPAFAAFLKNVVIYFLPLFAFLLLMPFYYISALELKVQGGITALPGDALFIGFYPLMIICFAALVYSLISTFYLLDRLQPGTYHGLFVSLIFMRFVVYFGLAFGSLLWYKTALNNAGVPR